MGELREYTVTMNGTPTTVLLNEADAKQLGAELVGGEPAPAPEPEPAPAPAPVPVKASTPPNKARSTTNKG